MKKLRLNIDEVRVDSFETVDGEAAPDGTVLGQENITRTNVCGTCPAVSCAPCP